MLFIIRVLCFATALCGLAACGKDRCVGVSFPATNAAGVEANLTFKRLDAKWGVAYFQLRNNSEKTLEMMNKEFETIDLSNFKLSVAGGPAFAASAAEGNPAAAMNNIANSIAKTTNTIGSVTNGVGAVSNLSNLSNVANVSSVTNVSDGVSNLAHTQNTLDQIGQVQGTLDKVDKTAQIADQVGRDVHAVSQAGTALSNLNTASAQAPEPSSVRINQSAAWGTSKIPPGGSLNLTLKWRLTNQPKKNSAWTMRVMNLTQDGIRLPDIVISRPNKE